MFCLQERDLRMEASPVVIAMTDLILLSWLSLVVARYWPVRLDVSPERDPFPTMIDSVMLSAAGRYARRGVKVLVRKARYTKEVVAQRV